MRSYLGGTGAEGAEGERMLRGEVHDPTSNRMGGVAGHAGLFSTAADITKFADCMLRFGSPIFRPETVALFTLRQLGPAGTTRALGWDTPAYPSQSGKHFSEHSFGHLGFTGCSLWCDVDRQLAVTLLTNRTWPDRKNQDIKKVRPAIHDAVFEAFQLK